ncbi:MAG: PEP-CTERM sorting domain-containing protein [Candidatus Korobacteraceae bacterium]
MRKFSLLFMLVILCLATTAFADNIVFDLSPTNGTTSRGAGDGTGQGVSVQTTQTLSDVEFFLDSPNGGNFKYFVYDSTNTNLLFLTTFHVDPIQQMSWVSTPVNFTLQAGNTYNFGVISDSSADYGYIFPPINYSNNGLTAITTGNDNYSGYGVPVFSGNGAAEIGLRLSEVPEPGSMILLGTGVLGLAGVLRRKLML